MFEKLKSLFIVTDPASATTPATPETDQVEASSAQSPSSAQGVSKVSTPTSAAPVNDLTDLLLRAIESNNQEGFDYIEFKNSLKSLEKVIPDESTRYKSAFEMGKTMGLTKESLIKYAGFYAGILDAEKKKFGDAVQNQRTSKIQERSAQLKSIEATIAEKTKMIDQLNKEIAQANEQLKVVKAEIDESASKIDQRNAQFQASFSLVYNQIANDLEKIKLYI
jgi:hypothetical protein